MISRPKAFQAIRPINVFSFLGTLAVARRPIPRQRLNSHGPAGLDPLEDAQLIKRIQAGQTEAYGELVHKYQDRVFNACWRICGHLEDARDVTQEAFLKAFEGLSDFRRESGFYTWIFRIAVNLALTHRRDTARRHVVSLDQASGVASGQARTLARRAAHHPNEDPADSAGAAELHGCVARAVQELEDEYRAVIVLRDIEGLDYRTVAEILGIPPGTVKSRLHRARMTLCEAIRPALARER